MVLALWAVIWPPDSVPPESMKSQSLPVDPNSKQYSGAV
jgi:hypothetical protein